MREIAFALTVFGSRAAALATLGDTRPFARLEPELQDRMLAAWERSRLPHARTIFQALRRVVLASWYALPDVQLELGYPGPFHLREPNAPWEGALPGRPSDAEPVARTADPARNPFPEAARDDLLWRARHPVPRGVVRGREVAADTHLTADVVVIGTGAGGAVAAARLAEAGHDVVVLEEGGYWTAGDFDERESPLTERLYADGGARATDDLSIPLLQGRAVGGGTTVNWLVMLRTPDWVLDEWGERHGIDGMTPRDMAPVFDQVEREVHARQVPDDAHSPNNRLLLDGAARLGWRVSAATINARGCVRSGFCGVGCRYDAKQSTLATYVPRALAAGARLFSDARAERVAVVERGGSRGGRRFPLKRVTATVANGDSGAPRTRLTIDAPVVVVAAGAVGTPALLQRSGIGGGGIGRYLRLHPTTALLGVYDRPVQASTGIPLSAVCDEFVRHDRNGYGFWIECTPVHPVLAATAAPGFGEAHRALMRRYEVLGVFIALVRDGADRGRSSGSVHVDRTGRTRIRYRLGPGDRRHLAESVEATARLHLAAGAAEVRTLHANPVRIRDERDLAQVRSRSYGPNQIGLFSAHVNGTCRMGTDPRTSGTSPDGEHHRVPGLFVCDGSLLPTAPGVNPQETIMALATVIAGRIAARMA